MFLVDWLGYYLYNQSFTTKTMVKLYRVAKPLLICGYHGLTVVTMFFWFYF